MEHSFPKYLLSTKDLFLRRDQGKLPLMDNRQEVFFPYHFVLPFSTKPNLQHQGNSFED